MAKFNVVLDVWQRVKALLARLSKWWRTPIVWLITMFCGAVFSTVYNYYFNPDKVERIFSDSQITLAFNVVAYDHEKGRFYTNTIESKTKTKKTEPFSIETLPSGPVRYYFSLGPEKANAYVYVVQRDDKGKINMIFPRLTPDIRSKLEPGSWTGSVRAEQTIRFPEHSEILFGPDSNAEYFYVFAYHESNQALDEFTQALVSSDDTEQQLNRRFSLLLSKKRAIEPFKQTFTFATDLSAPKTFNPQTSRFEGPKSIDIAKTMVNLCIDCYYKISIQRGTAPSG